MTDIDDSQNEVLEHCRKVRREITARFETLDEYFDFLVEQNQKNHRRAAKRAERFGLKSRSANLFVARHRAILAHVDASYPSIESTIVRKSIRILQTIARTEILPRYVGAAAMDRGRSFFPDA